MYRGRHETPVLAAAAAAADVKLSDGVVDGSRAAAITSDVSSRLQHSSVCAAADAKLPAGLRQSSV